MTEDEIALDYMSEYLLFVALHQFRKDKQLSDRRAHKAMRKMKPTLLCIEMSMQFIEPPETAREAASQIYMQRLLCVRLLMGVFMDTDLGITTTDSGGDVERVKMTMPEVKDPAPEVEMPHPIYESLKTVTLVILASFLKRARQDTHDTAVGLAAFVVHFLTLQAYCSLENPNSIQAVRHMFSFRYVHMPKAAMKALKRQLQLLTTAYIVEEADLEEYMRITPPLFLRTVKQYVDLVNGNMSSSFLRRNLESIMERTPDRVTQQ